MLDGNLHTAQIVPFVLDLFFHKIPVCVVSEAEDPGRMEDLLVCFQDPGTSEQDHAAKICGKLLLYNVLFFNYA